MPKGFELIKTTAEDNYAPSEWLLSFCYRKGLGTLRDDVKAEEYRRRTAEHGQLNAQLDYARLLLSEDRDLQPYHDLAAEFCAKILKRNKVVEAADLLSIHKIRKFEHSVLSQGGSYVGSEGLWTSKFARPEMVEDIVASLEFSAECGNVKNQIALACAYFVGERVKYQFSLTADGMAKHFKRATGDGPSLAKNYEKAFKFASLASEKTAEGALLLGKMYHEGLGVKQDPAKAIAHWVKAASLKSSFDSPGVVNKNQNGDTLGADKVAISYLESLGAKKELATVNEALNKKRAEEDKKRAEEERQQEEKELNNLKKNHPIGYVFQKFSFIFYLLFAYLAFKIWDKFLVRRCPSCKSKKYMLLGKGEIDRWIGEKKVPVKNSKGETLYENSVSVTYKKIESTYKCTTCSEIWKETSTVEAG